MFLTTSDYDELLYVPTAVLSNAVFCACILYIWFDPSKELRRWNLYSILFLFRVEKTMNDSFLRHHFCHITVWEIITEARKVTAVRKTAINILIVLTCRKWKLVKCICSSFYLEQNFFDMTIIKYLSHYPSKFLIHWFFLDIFMID